MESKERALRWELVSEQVRKLDPRYKDRKLPTGVNTFIKICDRIYILFDSKPFYSEAWDDDERHLLLRTTIKKGQYTRSFWTAKAWKTCEYVDLFLVSKNLLPDITIDGG